MRSETQRFSPEEEQRKRSSLAELQACLEGKEGVERMLELVARIEGELGEAHDEIQRDLTAGLIEELPFQPEVDVELREDEQGLVEKPICIDDFYADINVKVDADGNVVEVLSDCELETMLTDGWDTSGFERAFGSTDSHVSAEVMTAALKAGRIKFVEKADGYMYELVEVRKDYETSELEMEKMEEQLRGKQIWVVEMVGDEEDMRTIIARQHHGEGGEYNAYKYIRQTLFEIEGVGYVSASIYDEDEYRDWFGSWVVIRNIKARRIKDLGKVVMFDEEHGFRRDRVIQTENAKIRWGTDRMDSYYPHGVLDIKMVGEEGYEDDDDDKY